MMVEEYGVKWSKLKIKGVGYLQEQYISLTDLRKVSGIGDKTIERIKEQLLQNELDGNYKSEYDENIKLDVSNIYQGDCLELMNGIPDGSIDMILCDLPYGTTACKWDDVIDFNKLWKQYNRVIKDNGAIVLFGSEPFSSRLRNSNIHNYRYDWVWNKRKAGNIFLTKYQPMKIHEDIMIFSKETHNYYPIMVKRDQVKTSKNYGTGESMGGDGTKEDKIYTYTHKNPTSIIDISNASQKGKFHPTQKPVPLFEYLIKTYTKEGDLILDNCIGSGTTAISAINTNRSYIGIELDENYYNLAKNRINEHKSSILLK